MNNFTAIENYQGEQLLDSTLRSAQSLLQRALEAEATAIIERCHYLRDESGRKRVVRNGYTRTRKVNIATGRIAVKVPRLRDRKGVIRFQSSILPPYTRKVEGLVDRL